MSFYSETDIAAAMTVKLDDVLPEKTVFEEGIRRAPDRGFRLTQAQTEIALKMPYAMYLRSSTKKSFQNFWKNSKPVAVFMATALDQKTAFTANPLTSTREIVQLPRPCRS